MADRKQHEEWTRKKNMLKERLKRENRWRLFWPKRDEYTKKQGLPPLVGWVAAALHFPPADGSKPEFDQSDYDRAVAAMADPAQQARLRVATFNQGSKNLLGNEKELIDLQAAKLRLAEENGKAVAARKREQEWEELRKEVTRLERRKGWTRPTVGQQTLWAFDNAGTPPKEIDPKTVPGRGALRLLRQMDETAFYCDVARTVIAKYASKDESDERGFRDDNRKILEAMQRLEDVDTDLLDEDELKALLEQNQEQDDDVAFETDAADLGMGDGGAEPMPEAGDGEDYVLDAADAEGTDAADS